MYDGFYNEHYILADTVNDFHSLRVTLFSSQSVSNQSLFLKCADVYSVSLRATRSSRLSDRSKTHTLGNFG